MKNKKNKISNRERDNQINYMFKSFYELSQELRMVRSLFENYLIWKKDVEKFTKYLNKEEEKRKSEAGQKEQAAGSGTSEADSKPSEKL
jgi:hypothetical protein|tara:strand:- start:326 stop:592 length:267 start_codon:yes stop_codon:yes gene_type:complete